MGTDIHVRVQRRGANTSQFPWRTLDLRSQFERPNRYGIGAMRELRPREVDAPSALTNRNYDLFALLANVRNGRGFAGIKTGEGWHPLSEPRGLPEDYDSTKEGEAWLGDHSFSYATLAELLEFFATPQHTKQYGVIERSLFLSYYRNKTWGDRKAPHEYCGDVSGPNIKVVEEAEFNYEDSKVTHVRISWPETVFDACGAFIDCVLPWLTALAIDCGPENVRIVFGFDS